jgi:hypothetical protein
MVNNSSEQIQECYRQAAECARQADAETDPKVRGHLLELKDRWLSIARSYEYNTPLTNETNW